MGPPCRANVATILVKCVPTLARCRHANATTGAFGGAPHGATILMKGVPKLVRCRHANAATGAFGGASH
eukprot:3000180-Pyramimonas_sp.AAC.1